MFSNCLTTEIYFTNNSKTPLKFISNAIFSGSIIATEPTDLPEGLLMPGQTIMVRAEKKSGLLEGSFGPQFM